MKKPTQQDNNRLTAFLATLYEDNFNPVKKWHGGDKNDDGVITMPYPEYEPIVFKFIEAASGECWTDPDYLSKSPDQLLGDECIIKKADIDQIKTMLTFCVRGERFCTGHWEAMIKNGNVRRILERLIVLSAQ